MNFHPQKIGSCPKSGDFWSRATLELRIFIKKLISIDFPPPKNRFLPKIPGFLVTLSRELKNLKVFFFFGIFFRNPWAPGAPWGPWGPWGPWVPEQKIPPQKIKIFDSRVARDQISRDFGQKPFFGGWKIDGNSFFDENP